MKETNVMTVLCLIHIAMFAFAGMLSAALSVFGLAMFGVLLYEGSTWHEWGAMLTLGIVFSVLFYLCYNNLQFAVNELRRPA
ncbi:hypothetical protein [Dickeya sp. NCPPB 3274]|uniref:hypothetical protein n=1 Tax=Dickeya sp. NCPPB 3274 TaxID=568766 RepID=UPI0008FC15ED|nr:hypothetical protein [Dickeya sp. NCPPB 3274]